MCHSYVRLRDFTFRAESSMLLLLSAPWTSTVSAACFTCTCHLIRKVALCIKRVQGISALHHASLQKRFFKTSLHARLCCSGNAIARPCSEAAAGVAHLLSYMTYAYSVLCLGDWDNGGASLSANDSIKERFMGDRLCSMFFTCKKESNMQCRNTHLKLTFSSLRPLSSIVP